MYVLVFATVLVNGWRVSAKLDKAMLAPSIANENCPNRRLPVLLSEWKISYCGTSDAPLVGALGLGILNESEMSLLPVIERG